MIDIFGLIKKLREKDEEIGELHAENWNILQREAGTIDAYHAANKAAKELRAETEEWKNKYSAVYEKYLNLLERYEKVLESKPDARREIAERWLNDD
jgi:hypothetical protein